jgi:hypothetical protein
MAGGVRRVLAVASVDIDQRVDGVVVEDIPHIQLEATVEPALEEFSLVDNSGAEIHGRRPEDRPAGRKVRVILGRWHGADCTCLFERRKAVSVRSR